MTAGASACGREWVRNSDARLRQRAGGAESLRLLRSPFFVFGGRGGRRRADSPDGGILRAIGEPFPVDRRQAEGGRDCRSESCTASIVSASAGQTAGPLPRNHETLHFAKDNGPPVATARTARADLTARAALRNPDGCRADFSRWQPRRGLAPRAKLC